MKKMFSSFGFKKVKRIEAINAKKYNLSHHVALIKSYQRAFQHAPKDNFIILEDDCVPRRIVTKIKIPSGTQSGKQFRLKGKGMPFMRRGDYGDLYVQVNTEVPVSLNKEQKELLEKFRKIENERSNPSIKKFFQKAKSFWKN